MGRRGGVIKKKRGFRQAYTPRERVGLRVAIGVMAAGTCAQSAAITWYFIEELARPKGTSWGLPSGLMVAVFIVGFAVQLFGRKLYKAIHPWRL